MDFLHNPAMMEWFAVFIVAYAGFILTCLVFGIIVAWKIFVKAGQPGWAVLIPFYNLYIYTQIIRRPKWWILLYLSAIIPLLGALTVLVISIVDSLRMSRVFGKGDGFAVGLILLGFVFYPILAFGSDVYDGHQVDGPVG